MRSVVVCGLGRFGLHVVEALREAGRGVTVISDGQTSRDRLDRAVAVGARIVNGDFRHPSVRREAGVGAASAVLLVTASDVDNLEAALEIRGESPEVPVIMRHSEQRFARRFEHDFGIAAAMAPADLAAGAFVEAAMAATEQTATFDRRERIRVPSHRVRFEFFVIPLVLVALYAAAILIFRQTLDLGWVDAAYFATSVVTTVLLTLFIVSGAAMQLRNEFLARRLREHVVVCGLGQVGVAVARDLHRRGIPVAAVDPAACDDLHRELHLRCPVIAGDATRPAVLVRAGISQARAVVACTSNDALNLEIGLTAQGTVERRSGERPLRLVLRCFDSELARRIHAVSDNYTLLSEATIATPFFVRVALASMAAPTSEPA